jgi:hypothetical protein
LFKLENAGLSGAIGLKLLKKKAFAVLNGVALIGEMA